MDQIYILKKKKLMYGPYTLQVIKEKGLKQTDLIWYKGLVDWTPVENVKNLSDFIITEKHISIHNNKKSFIQKIFSFLN